MRVRRSSARWPFGAARGLTRPYVRCAHGMCFWMLPGVAVVSTVSQQHRQRVVVAGLRQSRHQLLGRRRQAELFQQRRQRRARRRHPSVVSCTRCLRRPARSVMKACAVMASRGPMRHVGISFESASMATHVHTSPAAFGARRQPGHGFYTRASGEQAGARPRTRARWQSAR